MKLLLEKNQNEVAQAEAVMENARAADGGHTFLTQSSQLAQDRYGKKASKASKTVGKTSFIKSSTLVADEDDQA